MLRQQFLKLGLLKLKSVLLLHQAVFLLPDKLKFAVDHLVPDFYVLSLHLRQLNVLQLNGNFFLFTLHHFPHVSRLVNHELKLLPFLNDLLQFALCLFRGEGRVESHSCIGIRDRCRHGGQNWRVIAEMTQMICLCRVGRCYVAAADWIRRVGVRAEGDQRRVAVAAAVHLRDPVRGRQRRTLVPRTHPLQAAAIRILIILGCELDGQVDVVSLQLLDLLLRGWMQLRLLLAGLYFSVPDHRILELVEGTVPLLQETPELFELVLLVLECVFQHLILIVLIFELILDLLDVLEVRLIDAVDHLVGCLQLAHFILHLLQCSLHVVEFVRHVLEVFLFQHNVPLNLPQLIFLLENILLHIIQLCLLDRVLFLEVYLLVAAFLQLHGQNLVFVHQHLVFVLSLLVLFHSTVSALCQMVNSVAEPLEYRLYFALLAALTLNIIQNYIQCISLKPAPQPRTCIYVLHLIAHRRQMKL